MNYHPYCNDTVGICMLRLMVWILVKRDCWHGWLPDWVEQYGVVCMTLYRSGTKTLSCLLGMYEIAVYRSILSIVRRWLKIRYRYPL